MKKTLISLVVIAVLGFGGYFLMRDSSDKTYAIPDKQEVTDTVKPANTTPKEETAQVDKTKTVIGTSVDGNNIIAYHFGDGPSELLFVGGIHGGYEWNTV